MHHVGQIDWSFTDRPAPASATSSGLARLRIVGPDQGAVHTELAVVGLMHRAVGWRRTSIRSRRRCTSSKASCCSTSAARVHRLVDGDYALIPTGLRHALGNSGREPVRFLSLNSPQRLDPAGARRDTFFEPAQDLARMDADAVRPPFGDPTLRLVGHYEGTPRSSRRSGSRIRPAAAPRPGWTPRSWPTAGSR